MSRLPPELEEQQILEAFVQARSLARSEGHVAVETVRSLEERLRPVAEAADVQRTMVTLLDRVALHSLAMLWDSAAINRSIPALTARAERWLRLGAPELALVVLVELQALGKDVQVLVEDAKRALVDARPQRTARLEANMAAIEQQQPVLAAALKRCQRQWVPLTPLGAGLACHGPQGNPHVQLWGVTPDEALEDAEDHLTRLEGVSRCFIAGVADGSMPILAARRLARNPNWLDGGHVHLVEPLMPRLRAMLEMEDLSASLGGGRLRIHAGLEAAESLSEALSTSDTQWERAVVGADLGAVTVIRRAVEIAQAVDDTLPPDQSSTD